jgi:hypothetical protein
MLAGSGLVRDGLPVAKSQLARQPTRSRAGGSGESDAPGHGQEDRSQHWLIIIEPLAREPVGVFHGERSEVVVRVHGPSPHPHLEVNVGRVAAAGTARLGDDVSAAH